jgi:hypothetical protein
MEVCGQLHAPAALLLERTLLSHCVWSSVDTRAGLDCFPEKGQISCPVHPRDSKLSLVRTTSSDNVTSCSSSGDSTSLLDVYVPHTQKASTCLRPSCTAGSFWNTHPILSFRTKCHNVWKVKFCSLSNQIWWPSCFWYYRQFILAWATTRPRDCFRTHLCLPVRTKSCLLSGMVNVGNCCTLPTGTGS